MMLSIDEGTCGTCHIKKGGILIKTPTEIRLQFGNAMIVIPLSYEIFLCEACLSAKLGELRYVMKGHKEP